MTSPDLNDPEIRALLDRNHVPKETKVVSGHDTSRIVETRVACDMCGLPYPCPTRQALRDRVKLVKETHDIVDCDDVPTTSHKAHAWRFRGADFWCPGG